MIKNIVRTILLIILIVFCVFVGSKILDYKEEHKDEIRIVYDVESAGYKEVWVKKGDLVSLENLSNDTQYGYDGWINEDEQYVYGPLIAEKNMMLKENYYYLDSNSLITITAIFDNGQPNITYKYQFGSHLMLPIDPVKEGYKFVGWINAETGETVTYDSGRQSITVKAVWEKE